MAYKRVTEEERRLIYRWQQEGAGVREAARRLGRAASSISREIARNTGGRGYRPQQARAQALARFLASKGLAARHVADIGLDEASDTVVWNHAVAHRMALVSKDEDFLSFANRAKKTTPWIWVRLGNCRKQKLLSAFSTALPQLLAALRRGDRIVELR